MFRESGGGLRAVMFSLIAFQIVGTLGPARAEHRARRMRSEPTDTKAALPRAAVVVQGFWPAWACGDFRQLGDTDKTAADRQG